MPVPTHQVWEKLTNYMEIEPRWVANRPGNFIAANEDLVDACDENTIGRWAHLFRGGRRQL
jgi:glutamate/tyrosine decarboxylase-like PLP-dependent enzyme